MRRYTLEDYSKAKPDRMGFPSRFDNVLSTAALAVLFGVLSTGATYVFILILRVL